MIRCRECGGLLADNDFELAGTVRMIDSRSRCARCGDPLDPAMADCPKCASRMLDDLLRGNAPSAASEAPTPSIGPSRSATATGSESRLRPNSVTRTTPRTTPTPAVNRQSPAPQSNSRPVSRPEGNSPWVAVENKAASAKPALRAAQAVAPTASKQPSPPVQQGGPKTVVPPTAPQLVTPAALTPPVPARNANETCETLIKSLSSKNAETRREAAEALGKLGNRQVMSPLEPLLGDTDIRVRRTAAEALIELGHPKGEALRSIADRQPLSAPAPSPRPSAAMSAVRTARASRSSNDDSNTGTILKTGGIIAAAAVLVGGIWHWWGSSSAEPTTPHPHPNVPFAHGDP
jgi:hypothetical protein